MTHFQEKGLLPQPLREQDPSAKKAILFAGLTEAQVIEKAQAGDVACFEALYNRRKRSVFSLCLRITSNHAEAEDLTQETFLQLYRKIALLKPLIVIGLRLTSAGKVGRRNMFTAGNRN